MIELEGKHYVRMDGKKRIDKEPMDYQTAKSRLMGKQSLGLVRTENMIMIDVDSKDVTAKLLKLFDKTGVKTYIEETDKGCHVYFKSHRLVGSWQDCDNSLGLNFITTKSHMNNRGDTFRLTNKIITGYEVADCPKWLIFKNVASILNYDPNADDNKYMGLFKHCSRYRNYGLDMDDIKLISEFINDEIYKTRLDYSRLENIINSVSDFEIPDDEKNDFATSDRYGIVNGVHHYNLVMHLIDEHGVRVLGSDIYIYRNGSYKLDTAPYMKTTTIIKAHMNIKVITASTISAVIKLLQATEEAIPNIQEDDDYLVCYQNGIFNAKTGKHQPHVPEVFVTNQLNAKFNVLKDYKTWEDIQDNAFIKFMKETQQLSNEEINNILDYVSTSFIKLNKFKKFLCLYGESNTGKSIILNAVLNMIGQDNASSVDLKDISGKYGAGQLVNKLININGDSNTNRLTDISMIKQITGGDGSIQVEQKYKQGYSTRIYTKLLFGINQLPQQQEEQSDAWYNRIMLVHLRKVIVMNDSQVKLLYGAFMDLFSYMLHRLHLLVNHKITITESQYSKDLIKMLKDASMHPLDRWILHFRNKMGVEDNTKQFGVRLKDSTKKGIPFTIAYEDYVSYMNEEYSGVKKFGKAKMSSELSGRNTEFIYKGAKNQTQLNLWL